MSHGRQDTSGLIVGEIRVARALWTKAVGPSVLLAKLARTGSTLDLRLVVSLNAGDEDFAVDNFTVTAIPEPGSMVLLGMASLGMVFRRRR